MKSAIKKLVSIATLSFAAATASGALIDNVTYVTDSNSGLDWLDLSQTFDRSVLDVRANLQSGGDLYGWTYATFSDLTSLFDVAGGNGSYHNTSGHSGVYNELVTHWAAGSDHNQGNQIWAHLADSPSNCGSSVNTGLIMRDYGTIRHSTCFSGVTSEWNAIGHALFRQTGTTAVSEPGALALLGIGLAGLGWTRRKTSK